MLNEHYYFIWRHLITILDTFHEINFCLLLQCKTCGYYKFQTMTKCSPVALCVMPYYFNTYIHLTFTMHIVILSMTLNLTSCFMYSMFFTFLSVWWPFSHVLFKTYLEKPWPSQMPMVSNTERSNIINHWLSL